jgi:hypothetical protein
MKRGTVILIKAESCNALLRTLLVSINMYLKSFLRYKFLILHTYNPDTLFMWVNTWGAVVIFLSQKVSASKKSLGNAAINHSVTQVWDEASVF